MRNYLLALSLVSLVAGSVPAFAADAVLDYNDANTAKVGQQTLAVPTIKSRRKMLFEFGALGTEMHFGWKRRMSKEEANGRFRGIPGPVLFTSIGSKAFGLNAPKREKIVIDKNG
jgi:hypothetical protein